MTVHPDTNPSSSNLKNGTSNPFENTMSHGAGGDLSNPQSGKAGNTNTNHINNKTADKSENNAKPNNPQGGINSNPDNQKTSKSGNNINSTEENTKTYYQQSTFENIKEGFNSWNVIKYIAIAFPFLLLYIYNSLHTAKAIKKKDELSKVLKELHSERISLESEITRASKQTQIAEKLKSTGLKEITTPPIKLTRERKD
jgi:hypothetical protein